MKVEVFLTHEITSEGWSQITKGFNLSFGLEKSDSELPEYYGRNLKGYSYHAISKTEEGKIIAHTSIVPQLYNVKEEEFWFGLSGGSYVLKEYRNNAFLYSDILNAVFERGKSDGLFLVFGVPNRNVFQYNIKLLGSVFIKDLKYYMLPVSPLKIVFRKPIGWIDTPFQIIQKGWTKVNQLLSFSFNLREKEAPIRLKLSEKYYETRFDDKYREMHIGDYSAFYRLKDEEGIQTAYLIDFRHNETRDYRSLTKAVAYILKNEKVDLIVFVGEISFFQLMFLEVPQRLTPKRMPLTVNFIQEIDEAMIDFLKSPENWGMGLMNIDVR